MTIWLRDLTRSSDKPKPLYLHHHSAYDHVKKACIEKVGNKNLLLNLSIPFMFMQKHQKETCLMLFI